MRLLGTAGRRRAGAAAVVLLAGAAAGLAQPAAGPEVTLTLVPEGPITVGTPVSVTATVLVPTWMPQPPRWPDLQIADAITRLPERATHPVTRPVGGETWSGLSRTWEIIPQRPAEFDLGAPTVTVAWADPTTRASVEATVPLPEIAFTAIVPPGAEGMDPFLPASRLTIEATLQGLPENPQPGDGFTLTVTTTAAGPPAILLSPLADRLATPPGLRAYPRQPALADAPGDPPVATRVEATAYVIERPGDYALPPIALEWWNTASQRRERAATPPISFTVAAPPGWRDEGSARPGLLVVLAGAAALAAALAAFAAFRRRPRRPPSERSRYRDLRRAIRRGTAAQIRARLSDWRAARPEADEALAAAIEPPLRDLERIAYGPSRRSPAAAGSEHAARRALLAAAATARAASPRVLEPALPAMNPAQP